MSQDASSSWHFHQLFLLGLPLEILILILGSLEPTDLLNMSLTSRYSYSLVMDWGWHSYLMMHPDAKGEGILKGGLTLSKWDDSRAKVRYIHLTDRGWVNRKFVARPLHDPWRQKLHPFLAVDQSGSKLAVAAGSEIFLYNFFAGYTNAPTQLRLANVLSVPPQQINGQERKPDITALALSRNNASFCESAIIALDNGDLREVELPSNQLDPMTSRATNELRQFANYGATIESMSSHEGMLLTFARDGVASIYSLRSSGHEDPSAPLDAVRLNDSRGWATAIARDSSYITLGSSSRTPLTVIGLRESGIALQPIAYLSRGPNHPIRKSAVYDICRPPLGFPCGSGSDHIIISAWYDGKVRMHDLRDHSRNSEYSGSGGLSPCQVLWDPWTVADPKYSVSAGGPAGACIASGSSHNSIICLWDVRQPKNGWSVYAPGNDRSPIYSLILEHSRLWCANQSRTCVIDFGPDVTTESYPPLRPSHRTLMPKPGTNGLSYLATYYSHVHDRQGLCKIGG